MCRLLAVSTRVPAALEDSLPSALTDFRELSHQHKDGWGMVWYDADGMQIHVDDRPAWSDDLYRNTAHQAFSNQTVVHLRRASPGISVELANCHPFGEGAVSFSHNGGFPVTDRLIKWCANHGVRPRHGTTDSELFFGMILYYANTLSWPEAIVAAGQQITDDMRVADPSDAPESLNCILTTPHALYAYTKYNPARVALRDDPAPDTYHLRLLHSDDQVVITSTHWPLEGTSVIQHGAVVEVERGTLTITTHQFDPCD